MNYEPRVHIRLSRPEDRAAVLRFSEHTWDWGDYLGEVWDDWLQSGKMLVATIDRKPVAVAHIALVAPREAWFEGLRVDPVYRQRGLATKMTERCDREAFLMGAKVVRFATLAENTPVHRIAARLGYRRVASLLTLQAEGIAERKSGLLPAGLSDLPQLKAFLKQSRGLKATGGLCSFGWRLRRLSPALLRSKLADGEVSVLRSRDVITAVAMANDYSDGIAVCFADAVDDKLEKLAMSLRAEAIAYEPPQVTVWLPEVAPIQEEFKRAGYEAVLDHPLWIFELRLKRLVIAP